MRQHSACQRRADQRLPRPTFLALALAALLPACGGKQTPSSVNPAAAAGMSSAAGSAKFDRSRCDDQGKQVVTLDANGDGKHDIIKLFIPVMQEGHTTQQLVCKQTDLDFDGKIDLVQYYGPAGDVIADEYSMDYSGKFSGRTFFQDRKPVRGEKDMDFNGKPDYFEFYEGGRLVRVERDRNADGRVDEWQYYEGGRLDRIGWDTTGSGRVDKWERNPEGGAETPAAQAAAAAAGAVAPTTPAGAADAAAAAAAASAAAKGGPKVQTDTKKPK